MSREEYMDEIDKLIEESHEYELIESILDQYGASEDDSDPDEGYYVTMSEDDLRRAYDAIVDRLAQSNDPQVRYETLSKQSRLSDYDQGWLDGYDSALGR